MKTITVRVPRINDDLSDFRQLARIWSEVLNAGDGISIIFDFSRCDFLRPNAVVFLGGLVRLVQHRGGLAQLLVDTMREDVRANLMQNGFGHAMGANVPPWSGNSIPYREDRHQEKDDIVRHLKRNWLGRGWINVSLRLANEITSQMWEIFANAFEHSRTPVGVFSCGQYIPKLQELLLAVADFGVGIPSNARLCADASYDGAAAMRWAFSKGTSSAGCQPGPSPGFGSPRGLGLDLLKNFVSAAQGTLEVFSHDGYARIDRRGEKYHNLAASFEGTLVQVRLHCDDKYYILASESLPEPYF